MHSLPLNILALQGISSGIPKALGFLCVSSGISVPHISNSNDDCLLVFSELQECLRNPSPLEGCLCYDTVKLQPGNLSPQHLGWVDPSTVNLVRYLV